MTRESWEEECSEEDDDDDGTERIPLEDPVKELNILKKLQESAQCRGGEEEGIQDQEAKVRGGHPFIVQLLASRVTLYKVQIVMEYCRSGNCCISSPLPSPSPPYLIFP